MKAGVAAISHAYIREVQAIRQSNNLDLQNIPFKKVERRNLLQITNMDSL
jgi:hypothetical protein